MKLLAFFAVMVSIYIATSSVVAQTITNDLSMTLVFERSECAEGSCPSYRIELSKDGHLQYFGRKNVKLIGEAVEVVSPQQLRDLKFEIARSGFFELRNEYTSQGCRIFVTDNPWVTIKVGMAKKRKVIRHYLGCVSGSKSFTNELERLENLETAIDKILDTQKWTTP